MLSVQLGGALKMGAYRDLAAWLAKPFLPER